MAAAASSSSSVEIAANANSIPTKQSLLTAIDDIEIVALGMLAPLILISNVWVILRVLKK